MAADDAQKSALERHDRALAEAGLEIWLGGEPTFTDRSSFDAQWNSAARGDEKFECAKRFSARLAALSPGALLLRTLGRQYPDEDAPRFNFGIYARRDGQTIWRGPRDPIAGGKAATREGVLRFRDALAKEMKGQVLSVDAPLSERVVVGEVDLNPQRLPALARRSWFLDPIPDSGPVDELADEGVLMFALGLEASFCRLTLPAFQTTDAFLAAIQNIESAARSAKLEGLILGGFPPPIDASIRWTTVTPDPGVLEINTAPHAGVVGYAREAALVHQIAHDVGLDSQRYFYNGDVSDSGGGGQLTFGASSPKASPFFTHPRLLPRLVAFFNQHPSLSYWLGLDAVGGSSQAPRPDEGARETFEEMGVALDALAKEKSVSKETLWASLAPHLCDRFGNAHRSELNIEKLWNPLLPMRGKLGLVEVRALRMARSPQRAVATAVFLRSILAHLAASDDEYELVDWGAELHDTFSLPFFLQKDFRAVLSTLESGAFGLDPVFKDELLSDGEWRLGRVDLGDAAMDIRRAREYWPLLGDLSHERSTHRLVDPSTARIEVRLLSDNQEAFGSWELSVDGVGVPWSKQSDASGKACMVAGIRYRATKPELSLHPLVMAHGPLVLQVRRGSSETATRITMHDWSPTGEIYDGLPKDAAEASARRAERFVVEPSVPTTPARSAPKSALSKHCIDTRRF